MLARLSILAILVFIPCAQSWSCNVHKLTINMIQPYLSEKKENRMLDILNHSSIVKENMQRVEHISDPVCLPDSIKRNKHYRSTAKWHYLDIDYDSRSDEPISESFFSPNDTNLYTAIVEHIEEKGDSLLFLLHLLGDATQPFHVIQLLSLEYPAGDKGGLKYSLYRSSFKNLHYLTDNVANYFSKKDFRDPDLFTSVNQYCEENNLRGDVNQLDIEDMVEDWLIETHNRGIEIYNILGESHHVTKEMKIKIQEVLLEGICRSTTILMHVLSSLV